jgi:hypothetical protein
MKNRTATIFTILLALVLLAPATTANSAGRTAKTIANTILNGKDQQGHLVRQELQERVETMARQFHLHRQFLVRKDQSDPLALKG